VIPLRRFIAPFTLVLFVTIAAAATPAADRIEAIIPADTDMVLMIDDVPRFLERWSESPLGRAWNDPQMKRFLAPMREDMEIDRWEEIVRGETGLELDEILGAFTGQVALLLPNLQQIIEAAEDEDPEQVAVLAEIGKDDEVVRRLLELDLDSSRDELEENEKLEELEEEFQGEILHVRRLTTADGEEESEGWAIVEGFAVMAEPKSYLQQIVAALKERASDSPLKENPGFRKVRGRVPATDLLLYFNFNAVLPMIEETIKRDLDNPEGPNPMGLTGQAVLDALAFDAIQSLFLSTTMLDGATHIDVGLQYTANRGLIKILAFEPGPVQLPGFLPDDAVEASVANFSLGVFGSLGNRIVAAKYLRPAAQPVAVGHAGDAARAAQCHARLRPGEGCVRQPGQPDRRGQVPTACRGTRRDAVPRGPRPDLRYFSNRPTIAGDGARSAEEHGRRRGRAVRSDRVPGSHDLHDGAGDAVGARYPGAAVGLHPDR
jgi:hypothetical protein